MFSSTFPKAYNLGLGIQFPVWIKQFLSNYHFNRFKLDDILQSEVKYTEKKLLYCNI